MGIINGFFVGPLLSVFLLGFLTKRANSFGAFSGMIAGTALTAVVARMPVPWLPVSCSRHRSFRSRGSGTDRSAVCSR